MHISTDIDNNIDYNIYRNLHESYKTIKIDTKVLDLPYSISNDTCYLNFKENWIGLTTKDAKKSSNIKKESYLDKCPGWDNIEVIFTRNNFYSCFKKRKFMSSIKLDPPPLQIKFALSKKFSVNQVLI